jgi:AcrR family transcriptional regulator
MPRKAGPNDEARERSRAQLLQAGADLMLDQATQNPFAALRLRRLCEKAGLSTGAFYVHWATMEQYCNDLAGHLTQDRELAYQADFASLSDLAGKCAGQDAAAAVARLAKRDLETVVGNPLWDAMELVNLTWGRTRFPDELKRAYATIDRATGQIYGSAFAERRREPRPPLDWDGIGAVIQALVDGFGLRYKIDPAVPLSSPEPAFDLYAIAVAAVLAVLTRPAGDDASTDETIQDLLNT